MATNTVIENLKVVSYNMHGFMQGFSVLEDFTKIDSKPDVFLLQEHWLAPSNLDRFDKYFPDYFSFGCSAMAARVETCMLRGRPYGGVMTLINKKLRKLVETIHCEDRFTVVRVVNYLIINVYFPCAGTANRLFVCEELLANLSALYDRYSKYQCIIAGDFNTNLDAFDPVAVLINNFLSDYSLIRCDDIFPSRKSATYINESLGHVSCIDYVLVSDVQKTIDFAVCAPDVNFSDHLPLVTVIKCDVCVDDDVYLCQRIRGAKPVQLQLRWDKGDTTSYYQYTGQFLAPLLASVEEMLSLFNEIKTHKLHQIDTSIFIDHVYNEIVTVLSNAANAYVPTYRKNFLKFWWNEELTALKADSVESNKLWKAAGKPRSGQISEKRRTCRVRYRKSIKDYERMSTEMYTNELHEALLYKDSTNFWKCWRSKFESPNVCKQVEGCVDVEVIVDKFRDHFVQSYTANNVNRAVHLKESYLAMRENYCGFPIVDNDHFSTEIVSKIIFDMKRGKAPDIDGLTVEHLQFSHPVLSVLLSKLFMLIVLSRCVPKGFKKSYIVPIPKVKDCRTKAMSCGDFRGIAISPALSKVFEHCLLKQLQSLINSDDSQFGFKKGLSCSHAIYTVRNIVNRWVSRGSTANLCAIDLSKAFDKVNHHALFIKLMHRNIPAQILELIENLFNDCCACVKWGQSWSSDFIIHFGVRQGSVLSPFLFAIYLNDLSVFCKPEYNLYVILYADDILLLAPTLTSLERLLNECENQLGSLDMAINFGKSACLRIGQRCDAACANIVSISGQTIPWVTKLRYLGIHIMNSRSFKCSFDTAKRSFYRAANAIFCKIGRRASEDVTLELVRTKCLPALLYGLEACPLRVSDCTSLDFVINRFFMKLFKTNSMEIVSYCRTIFQFELPSTQVSRRTQKFIVKYRLSDNLYCKYA